MMRKSLAAPTIASQAKTVIHGHSTISRSSSACGVNTTAYSLSGTIPTHLCGLS